MPNIAAVLREEIARLARKEVRAQVGPLQKKGADHRRHIAALRREIAGLERQIAGLRKQIAKSAKGAPAEATGPTVRFSPKWVAADRSRLGLSARDYGRLVGVTQLTIYNWEKGKSKPQARQLASWAKVRGIGKREAWKRLDALDEE
jgi:DNA-binding transcriptional regulator YiaG